MSQQFLSGCIDIVSARFLAYLVLSMSKQVGRYLSNKMVRLALSVWTSLWSIQLLTGGFHPRSAGLMYRIPECTGMWLGEYLMHVSRFFIPGSQSPRLKAQRRLDIELGLT